MRLIRTTLLSLLVLSLALPNWSCRKSVKNGDLEGGIALTFDDQYVDDWYSQLPLLDSMGAKATFYVSNYSSLTKEQKKKLKILEQHGNEIAFHSTHHLHMVRELKKKSLRQLMKEEVLDGLDSMHKDGFYPKNFAFPFGEHNDMLDAAMISVFRSIRLLNGSSDLTQSVCRRKEKAFFRALTIDDGGRSDGTLCGMLDNAKNHNNVVVLVGHHIESHLKPNVSLRKLRVLLRKAKELQLKFYTISELSR